MFVKLEAFVFWAALSTAVGMVGIWNKNLELMLLATGMLLGNIAPICISLIMGSGNSRRRG